MSRTRFDAMNCSVAQALEQIGDWWTLLIIRDAFLGLSRFSQFEKNLGIAKNILADRLQKLVEDEILETEPVDGAATRFEYKLTAKGRDLWLVLTALRLWSDKWVFGEGHEPLVMREHDTGRSVAALLATDAAGAPLDASKLRWFPGPGWDESQGP